MFVECAQIIVLFLVVEPGQTNNGPHMHVGGMIAALCTMIRCQSRFIFKTSHLGLSKSPVDQWHQDQCGWAAYLVLCQQYCRAACTQPGVCIVAAVCILNTLHAMHVEKKCCVPPPLPSMNSKILRCHR